MTVTLPALNGIVLAYLLCFARTGSMVMVLPAIGDKWVPARIRLLLAIGICAVIAPGVASSYTQAAPQSITALVLLICGEVLAGVLIGGIARIVVSALNVTGFFISMQTGLAMAQSYDPTGAGGTGAVVGNLLSLLGTVLIFVTNLHYLAIGAIVGSYHLIPPGMALPTDDLAQLAISTMSGAFLLGFKLAAPFLVFGFVVNCAFGVLGRLMPQLQIFFVVMPINILIGFSLLALFLGSLMTLFLGFYSHQLGMLQ